MHNKLAPAFKRGLFLCIDRLIVSLGIFASQFTGAALGFGGLADACLGRFFIMPAHFHFTKQAFALHLLFECAQRLIDVIIADNNFYQRKYTPFSNLTNV